MADEAPQQNRSRFLIRAVIIVAAVIGGSVIGYLLTVAIVGFLHVTGS